MTTLSKEDVVRMAIESGILLPRVDSESTGEPATKALAEDAIADLVAENERLKATPPDQRQDLHCVVSDIAAECRELRDQLTATRTALAAVEAREMKLREALYQVMDDIRSEAFLFDGGNGISADTEDAVDNLLAKPRDDSALREMIAGVYEECAKVCDASADRQDAEFDAYLKSGGKGPATNLSAIARGYANAIRALAEKACHGS